MAVKIVHAVGDENGKARGGQAGDQNGREIRVQNWYNREGGWQVVLECTDDALASRAVDFAIKIAADDSFGYDQDQRGTGLQAIQSSGDVSSAEDSEFDCSSLARAVYVLAGLKLANVSTRNMESVFVATGKFIAHREPEWLTSADYAKQGCLYLTAGKHVAIVISDGSMADLSTNVPINEEAEIDPPYVLVKGKVNVRDVPGKYVDDDGVSKFSGNVIYTARDERLPFEEFDDDTGWYGVMCPKGAGFVSNEIPAYAKLIKE